MRAHFLNGLMYRHCAQNYYIHTIHVWKGIKKERDGFAIWMNSIMLKKSKINLHKTVGLRIKNCGKSHWSICSALSPKCYWWQPSKNTSINFKGLVLGSRRSQVTEQLQKSQIKECLVPLVHGVLIRNKFWRSVWINTNGLTHCSHQQNKGESFV